jgi:demethylmenaquinone methyltransferase / 2-methoxy-6-polyprenyl-1,4-benzoquinol methylase
MVKMARKAAQKTKVKEADNDTTQAGFGFKPAAPDMRTKLVRDVFESVAPKYDVMNDIMSLGIHRLWKADFVRSVEPKASEAILDLAGGTGDIAFLMEKARKRFTAPNIKLPDTKITICDINPAMLAVGKQRAMDKGLHGKFNWVEGNAEELPFDDNMFDAVTIAFGLRNVTHLSKALIDIHRVLKPGGRFYCLEFSHIPVPMLQKLYDRYSFGFLPWMGEKVAGDRGAYQYLAESIRAFPDQQALVNLMQQAGFSAVRFRNLNMGIAAIHCGIKA